jgi:hypothetical protein
MIVLLDFLLALLLEELDRLEHYLLGLFIGIFAIMFIGVEQEHDCTSSIVSAKCFLSFGRIIA